MWSNVISIDKSYDREIDHILSRVQSTNKVSYAIEESEDRLWIYLAGTCENQKEIEEEIASLAVTVFLTYFKVRYFIEALGLDRLSYAQCALISSIVNFDREFEESIVRKTLCDTEDINFDGIMNFRLRALRDSWAELAEVTGRLLEGSEDDKDIFDIASFILGSDGGKNQLSLTMDALKNLTGHKTVEIIDLFDEEDYNLLSAIIREKPCEIVVKGFALSKPMRRTLKRIARVIEM